MFCPHWFCNESCSWSQLQWHSKGKDWWIWSSREQYLTESTSWSFSDWTFCHWPLYWGFVWVAFVLRICVGEVGVVVSMLALVQVLVPTLIKKHNSSIGQSRSCLKCMFRANKLDKIMGMDCSMEIKHKHNFWTLNIFWNLVNNRALNEKLYSHRIHVNYSAFNYSSFIQVV